MIAYFTIDGTQYELDCDLQAHDIVMVNTTGVTIPEDTEIWIRLDPPGVPYEDDNRVAGVQQD